MLRDLHHGRDPGSLSDSWPSPSQSSIVKDGGLVVEHQYINQEVTVSFLIRAHAHVVGSIPSEECGQEAANQ